MIARRDAIVASIDHERDEAFKLTQQIAVLQAQAERDEAAEAERAEADEERDRVLDLEAQLHEMKQDAARRRKRARSMQLGEDLEEDEVEPVAEEPPAEEPVVEEPVVEEPVEEQKLPVPGRVRLQQVDRYAAMTTPELIHIAMARGIPLPPSTPRSAVISVIDAPADETKSTVSSLAGRLADFHVPLVLPSRPVATEVMASMNDYMMDPPSPPAVTSPKTSCFCLGAIAGAADAHPTGCTHMFHSACLLQWAVSNQRTCPVCRHEFTTITHADGHVSDVL